jgi:pimeloyl-ACP methyl ester carboxylesterase
MTDLAHSTLDAKVGRIEMHRGGDGGPAEVLYLHSAIGESANVSFLEIVAATRKVTAPVFPGFGQSDGLDRINDMEDASFHLLDVLDRLGLGSVDLVGMSLGGWMAAELAVRWPERVRRMVLINPVGIYVEGSPLNEIFGRRLDELAGDLYADPDFPVAQLMRELAKMESDPGAIPFDLVRPVIQAQAATAKLAWNPYLHNPKLRGRLDRIISPTLIVHGQKDGIVGRTYLEAFTDGITGARLETLANAAHLAVIECPEEVAGMVTGFLDA